jgi:multimeric flavodoxin WrbA
MGCRACGACKKNKNNKCVFDNDITNEIIAKIVEADGLILASPTYFADVSAEMKAIIDRVGYVARANGNLLKRMPCASIVAARRAGGMRAFDSMNALFLIGEAIIVGSDYWNIGLGREKGDVKEDEEGLNTMKCLGQNMAWLLKKLS